MSENVGTIFRRAARSMCARRPTSRRVPTRLRRNQSCNAAAVDPHPGSSHFGSSERIRNEIYRSKHKRLSGATEDINPNEEGPYPTTEASAAADLQRLQEQTSDRLKAKRKWRSPLPWLLCVVDDVYNKMIKYTGRIHFGTVPFRHRRRIPSKPKCL